MITKDEQNLWLARDDVQDAPSYPGFALIRISGQKPFLVRKCYYDQDWLFDGLFRPPLAYANKYLPKGQQRLVGGEYTPDHFVAIRLPAAVTVSDVPVSIALECTSDEWFEAGDLLFSWHGPLQSLNKNALAHLHKKVKGYYGYDDVLVNIEPKSIDEFDKELHKYINAHAGTSEAIAPHSGKVVDYALNASLEDRGDILLLRFERPMSDADRRAFETSYFSELIGYLTDFASARGKVAARINEIKRNDELHRQKLEQDRKDEIRQEELKHEQAKLAYDNKYLQRLYGRISYFILICIPVLYAFFGTMHLSTSEFVENSKYRLSSKTFYDNSGSGRDKECYRFLRSTNKGYECLVKVRNRKIKFPIVLPLLAMAYIFPLLPLTFIVISITIWRQTYNDEIKYRKDIGYQYRQAMTGLLRSFTIGPFNVIAIILIIASIVMANDYNARL